MASTGPSAMTARSRSVTTVAISMIVSDSGLSPVISRSIHTRKSLLGIGAKPTGGPRARAPACRHRRTRAHRPPVHRARCGSREYRAVPRSRRGNELLPRPRRSNWLPGSTRGPRLRPGDHRDRARRAAPGRSRRAGKDVPLARSSGRDSYRRSRSPRHRPVIRPRTEATHRAAVRSRWRTAPLPSACGSAGSATPPRALQPMPLPAPARPGGPPGGGGTPYAARSSAQRRGAPAAPRSNGQGAANVASRTQKGSFIPGGSCSPAVTLAIFSWTRASSLCTASLAAAAIRSSSISRSSELTAGSIWTRFTSWRPFMVIFTMPPPASPITSIPAISACAFCMLACIAWACFIRLLKLPRMGSPVRRTGRRCFENASFYRPDGIGEHCRPKTLPQPLDGGVFVERPPRGGELGLACAPGDERRGLGACRAGGLEFDADALAEIARESLDETFLRRRCAQQLVARIERETHDGPLPADERAVTRELAASTGELEILDDRTPRITSGRRGAGRGPRRGGRKRRRCGRWCTRRRRGWGRRLVACWPPLRHRPGARRLCRGAKGDHAQQRHLEAAARVRSERQIALADDCGLIEELHVLRRKSLRELCQKLGRVQLIARVVAHCLLQADPDQESRELIEQLRVIGSEFLERLHVAQQLHRVPCREQSGDAQHLIARDGAEHGTRLALIRLARAECDQLIEQRERITHAAVGGLRDERQRGRLERHAFLGEDMLQLRGD